MVGFNMFENSTGQTCHWIAVEQEAGQNVALDPIIDGYWVEFRKERQLVKVHISDDQLQKFGNVEVEDLLRELLNVYVEKIGTPPLDIYASDLGPALQSLQMHFRTPLAH